MTVTEADESLPPVGSNLQTYADALGLPWERLAAGLAEVFPTVYTADELSSQFVPMNWCVRCVLWTWRNALEKV
jgi:hypothetical protein